MGLLVIIWNPLKVLVRHGTELWIYSSGSQPWQPLKMANLWILPTPRVTESEPPGLDSRHLQCRQTRSAQLTQQLTYTFQEGEQWSNLKILCFDVSKWNRGKCLSQVRVKNYLLPFIILSSTFFKVGFPAPIKCYCHSVNSFEIVQTIKTK